jgi:hypothetical protein
MTLKTICAALALSLALPAAAQDLGLDPAASKPTPKKDDKKDAAKKPAKGAAEVKKAGAPAPAAAPGAASAPLEPAAPAGKPAGPAAAAPDTTLQLDTQLKPKSGPKDLELLDVPGFDDLDLKSLQDVSLCVFPFIKEDKLSETGGAPGAKAAPQRLEAIQKIFYDVAKSSPLLKDAIVIGKDAPVCGIEDVACIASLGSFTGCTAVLAGRSTREDNGFSLRARMVDTKKGKLLGKVNQVMATDDDAQVAAWAEGQACRALKVDCKATVVLDADRPDMRVLIDNRPLERKPGAFGPETLTLVPGVYKVRVMIGQRNSREEVLSVRRGAKETVYARQLADGGIPLFVSGSLQKGNVPPKSVDVAGTRWTKPVGFVAMGLGAVAVGVSGQQYLHSKSLVDDANSTYTSNQGAYFPGDLDKASSAKSARTISTIAGIAGAALIVAGVAMVIFF